MRFVSALFAAVLALPASVAVPASASAADGPPLESDPAAMADALSCPDTFDGSDDLEPILLVHGTFATPEENWGWNYGAALPEDGWDVCTVRLPERSTGDIQVAAEYVVFAVRAIAARSGEVVDVMGHSQGVLQPRWAVKWWPDVQATVDDLVMLAGPNHGTAIAEPAYELGCFAACYQMAPQSNFIAALNRDDETPGTISYTSIYSATDELVQPAVPDATAAIDGATNILVQDLCPGRPVDHVGLVYDAAVHEMVIDALTRPGPADPARFDPLTCASVWFDGVDPTVFADLFFDNALTEAFGNPEYGGPGDEPALRPYAQEQDDAEGSGGAPDDPGGDGAATAGVRGAGATAGGADTGRGVLPATGGLPAVALGAFLVIPAAWRSWRRRGSA